MWDYVVDLNKKEHITIFFTTHYIEEAEKVAQRIIVIDHGKIVATGTPDELKSTTNTTTLEEAFLKYTGHAIRDEDASLADRMRLRHRIRHG
jgi:ABC-2 type transport system ATP-binding protein